MVCQRWHIKWYLPNDLESPSSSGLGFIKPSWQAPATLKGSGSWGAAHWHWNWPWPDLAAWNLTSTVPTPVIPSLLELLAAHSPSLCGSVLYLQGGQDCDYPKLVSFTRTARLAWRPGKSSLSALEMTPLWLIWSASPKQKDGIPSPPWLTWACRALFLGTPLLGGFLLSFLSGSILQQSSMVALP